MAIRTLILEGTDWVDGEILYQADLNATITEAVEVIETLIVVSKTYT